MTKQELRSLYLQKRRELSSTDWTIRSERISENFFASTDLSKVEFLHSFLPIRKNKEPDTWIILQKLKNDFPEISIVLPKVNQQKNELQNYVFRGPDSLVTNSWGIDEPTSEERIDPKKIDLILVPLLAFDKKGNRVGYGKGFYDKFLSECRGDALKIGISLFEGVEIIDDIDSYDQPLDYCITPEGSMRF